MPFGNTVQMSICTKHNYAQLWDLEYRVIFVRQCNVNMKSSRNQYYNLAYEQIPEYAKLLE